MNTAVEMETYNNTKPPMPRVGVETALVASIRKAQARLDSKAAFRADVQAQVKAAGRQSKLCNDRWAELATQEERLRAVVAKLLKERDRTYGGGGAGRWSAAMERDLESKRHMLNGIVRARGRFGQAASMWSAWGTALAALAAQELGQGS